jgi:hypothetical protein
LVYCLKATVHFFTKLFILPFAIKEQMGRKKYFNERFSATAMKMAGLSPWNAGRRQGMASLCRQHDGVLLTYFSL